MGKAIKFVKGGTFVKGGKIRERRKFVKGGKFGEGGKFVKGKAGKFVKSEVEKFVKGEAGEICKLLKSGVDSEGRGKMLIFGNAGISEYDASKKINLIFIRRTRVQKRKGDWRQDGKQR